jgi:hypothetical protein
MEFPSSECSAPAPKIFKQYKDRLNGTNVLLIMFLVIKLCSKLYANHASILFFKEVIAFLALMVGSMFNRHINYQVSHLC